MDIKYPTSHDSSSVYILKQNINQWANHYPHLADYKIGNILEELFKQIIVFLDENKLKLNCNIDEFWNRFVNFAYQYRANQYSKLYYI